MPKKLMVTLLDVPWQPIMEWATHSALFATLPQLCELHSRLEELLGAQHGAQHGVTAAQPERWVERLLAAFEAVLPEAAPLYTAYAAAFERVSEALAKASAQPEVAAHISRHEKQYQVNLSAMLFRPVQRMCAYPLLLREATKYAEKGSAAEAQLHRLLQLVGRLTAKVNENVRTVADERAHAALALSRVRAVRRGRMKGMLAAELLMGDRRLVLEARVEVLGARRTRKGPRTLRAGLRLWMEPDEP